MYIMKFGGTSVKNADAIRNVISIVQNRQEKAIVVVSACSQITNKLVSLFEFIEQKRSDQIYHTIRSIREVHEEIIDELSLGEDAKNFLQSHMNRLNSTVQALSILAEISPKFKDQIVSYGEQFSSFLISLAMKQAGIHATHVDSRDVIITDSQFTEAEVNFFLTQEQAEKHLLPLLKEHSCIVMGGFIASDRHGNTTTLGRGGSDYTASILGACLKAEAIEIWTDVHGVLTSDPRLIPDVKQISHLSFREAAELAYFGAKVLHPKTMAPAVQSEIPVYVKNTFHPEHHGTRIQSGLIANQTIKSIAYRKNITVINIQSNRMLGAFGFLSKVFSVFETHKVSVDLVTTSEVSISLTIDDDSKLNYLMADLEQFARVDVRKNQAIIAAVGEGIRDTAGVSAKFFNVVKGINISMVSVGASEVNLSIVVNETDVESAVKLLHASFFSENLDQKLFKEIA